MPYLNMSNWYCGKTKDYFRYPFFEWMRQKQTQYEIPKNYYNLAHQMKLSIMSQFNLPNNFNSKFIYQLVTILSQHELFSASFITAEGRAERNMTNINALTKSITFYLKIWFNELKIVQEKIWL